MLGTARGCAAVLVVLSAGSACNKVSIPAEEALRRKFEAASRGPVEVLIRDGRARTVRGKIPTTGSTAEQRARSFLSSFADAFGLTDVNVDCSLMGQVTVPGGGSVVMFRRQVGTRPVFGSEIRIALDSQGNAVHVSALLPTSVAVAAGGAVSSEQAGSTAAARVGGSKVASAELGVHDPGLLAAGPGEVRPAWLVRLEGDSPRLPAIVIVDAEKGEPLLAFDTVDRARQRNVYEVQGASDQPRTITEGQRKLLFKEGDGPPPATAPPQLLADYQIFEHAGVVHAFFLDTFGWDSWDGKGAPIDVYLRYGGPTSWMQRSIFLGADGMSFDSVAHELGHGVINVAMEGDANAELGKLFEAGALKESLSDLLAVFASFSAPTIEDDWLITDGKGQVDRDLAQVKSSSVTRYEKRKLLSPGADVWDPVSDKGHVHFNSGIPSFAVYLLVKGGLNPLSPTSATDAPVIGIGPEKTMQIVFRAVRLYLQHTGTFEDARYALLRACEDFAYRGSDNFGITVRDCGSLLNAWAAVGVGERDEDRDTWSDSIDNCPRTFNPVQEDGDSDQVGDACSSPGAPDAGPPGVPPSSVRCPPTFATRSCHDNACPEQSTCVTLGETDLAFIPPDGTASTTHDVPQFSSLYQQYMLRCAYRGSGPCTTKYTFLLNWVPKGFAGKGAASSVTMACSSPGEIHNDCTLLGSSTLATLSMPCLPASAPAAWRDEVLAHAKALLAKAEAEAEPCP